MLVTLHQSQGLKVQRVTEDRYAFKERLRPPGPADIRRPAPCAYLVNELQLVRHQENRFVFEGPGDALPEQILCHVGV
jgi:hypothetical protein